MTNPSCLSPLRNGNLVLLSANSFNAEIEIPRDSAQVFHRTRQHLICYRVMRRREFLTLSAASIGGVLLYSLDRRVFRLSAQSTKAIRIPLRFFSEGEA